ncbi:hypothetical protein BD779DRAFT_1553098 [Infundibulicybe gibba]|nr:hypothetical protein BD779DRAFT_1553098 [Infundibulicybe gibba]
MKYDSPTAPLPYKTSRIGRDSERTSRMVKTRGQQKLLECRPKRKTRSLQNTRQQTALQVQESNEDVENRNDTSENESDYGATIKGRAQKRRKHTQPTRKTLGKRTAKCFDLLFSMPLEIIFEVAGYLTPQDILSMSQTSKALCKMLHSPNTSSIWKAARSSVGAPECSPGFSEPRWASLLFGRPICEQCGTKNVHSVEFGIRRRVCVHCKKQHLVSAVRFEKVFPHYESSVMDMVPYTRSSGWTHDRSRFPGKFFWVSDAERIASEWAVLQKDIHMYVKGARAAAAAYRKQKIDEAERIAQHAKVCDDWLSYSEERSQEIQERLLELGYDNRDMNHFMFDTPNFQKDSKFTDQFWARIRPRAVAKVESNRDNRLERERAALWVERLNILRVLYDEYAESLAPLQWCYLPNIYELAELSVFRDILESDRNVSVSRQSFLPATGQLPTLVPEWISAKKERLISMLELSSSGTVNHPLDLATAVFVCTSHNCGYTGSSWLGNIKAQRALISWEAIAAHSCQVIGWSLSTSYKSTTLGFSQMGASTASSLVRLANLDPSLTTITEMDALDLRFACLQCPPLIPGRYRGYPWKSAVEHGMTTEHADWYRMSPEETQRIKQDERHGWDTCMAWSCNHCSNDLNAGWRTKSDAIHHLRNTHHIASPTEPSDLFWYPGNHRIPLSTLASTEIAMPVPLSAV